MILLGAFRAPAFCRFLAAGHLDPFSIHQCIGNLAPGLMEIAPRGFAGYPEVLGSLFLFEPFKVNEPDQFDLIGVQRDALAFLFRAAAGLVTTGFRVTGDGTPKPRPSPAGTLVYLNIFIRCHCNVPDHSV
jgi:hypothetical protein